MRHAIRRKHATDPAMSPDELLQTARELLGCGYDLPAAMTARAALETHIRDWHAVLGLDEPQRTTCFEYLHLLRRAGVIDRDQVKWIMAISDIGNRASHNYAVLGAEVEELLAGVAEFMATG